MSNHDNLPKKNSTFNRKSVSQNYKSKVDTKNVKHHTDQEEKIINKEKQKRDELIKEDPLGFLEDYFYTDGYAFGDLRLYIIDCYKIGMDGIEQAPGVRLKIEARGFGGNKFYIRCDKVKICNCKVVKENDEYFLEAHVLSNTDIKGELEKLIDDYLNEETTNPPKGE